MRLEQREERTLWRATVRVVAIMFLLLAIADLSFPQICAEDFEPLFPQRATSTFAHADDSGAPLPHPTPTEDCFCCCSHIMSEDSGSPLSKLAVVSGSDPAVLPALPPNPVQLLFRPPRLA